MDHMRTELESRKALMRLKCYYLPTTTPASKWHATAGDAKLSNPIRATPVLAVKRQQGLRHPNASQRRLCSGLGSKHAYMLRTHTHTHARTHRFSGTWRRRRAKSQAEEASTGFTP